MPIKPKLVILDRDGVINFDSDEYIKSADEWRAIPGSLEAIARLNSQGMLVAIATNQSGIGRGMYDLAALESMHIKLKKQLAEFGGEVAAIEFCPHLPTEGCECRKPKPGMLRSLLDKFSIEAKEAVFLGDSYKDVQAANAIGCRAALVLTGKGDKTLREHPELKANVKVYADLASFVESGW